MLHHFCLYLVAWAFSLISASATPAPGHLDGTYPAAGLVNTVGGRMLRRATTEQLFSKALDHQWDDGEVLFPMSELDMRITCRTCYIAGKVTGSYTYSADINTTQLEATVKQTVTSFVDDAEDALKAFIEDNSNFTNIDFTDVSLPSSEDFDYQLQYLFDDLELYMELDTVLSAESKYTLNLFTYSPPGVGLDAKFDGDDFSIGAFLTVDLVLSSSEDIDIISGVHIKVDSAAINIGMFENDVGEVTIDGGMFEFLNVSVGGEDFELNGTLRVGIHAGVGLDIDYEPIFDGSAGLGAGIYANIAKFTTTGTADSDNENCDVALVEAFTIALGAQAGATVAWDNHTWGPAPQTETPLWYTTLTTACATLTSASTTSSAAAIRARLIDNDDASIGTTTTKVYTIVSCNATGVINCPVSDQITITTASTFITTGSATAQASVSRSTFGSTSQDLVATSGPPSSYSPPPPPTATSTGGVGASGRESGTTGKDQKPLIIGLSVGLGVPALAIIAGAMFCLIHRRKRYSTVRKGETRGQVFETATATPDLMPEQQSFLKKTPTVVSSRRS
ncbi:hypothetical protein EDD37DRAFT_432215 [Exophiala viscosa]|uniref:uncharacterized protein n=1 Tax=Exophiala viscosa TaxID=2486360 RepID=UPI00218E7963|nr:hypothetical protein EDD37DRAFT_432215 [Exophiala viscosa]